MQQSVSRRRGAGEAIAGETASRHIPVAPRLRHLSGAHWRWATHPDHDGPKWMPQTHNDTDSDAANAVCGLECRGLVGTCLQQVINRGRVGLVFEGTGRSG